MFKDNRLLSFGESFGDDYDDISSHYLTQETAESKYRISYVVTPEFAVTETIGKLNQFIDEEFYINEDNSAGLELEGFKKSIIKSLKLNITKQMSFEEISNFAENLEETIKNFCRILSSEDTILTNKAIDRFNDVANYDYIDIISFMDAIILVDGNQEDINNLNVNTTDTEVNEWLDEQLEIPRLKDQIIKNLSSINISIFIYNKENGIEFDDKMFINTSKFELNIQALIQETISSPTDKDIDAMISILTKTNEAILKYKNGELDLNQEIITKLNSEISMGPMSLFSIWWNLLGAYNEEEDAPRTLRTSSVTPSSSTSKEILDNNQPTKIGNNNEVNNPFKIDFDIEKRIESIENDLDNYLDQYESEELELIADDFDRLIDERDSYSEDDFQHEIDELFRDLQIEINTISKDNNLGIFANKDFSTSKDKE